MNCQVARHLLSAYLQRARSFREVENRFQGLPAGTPQFLSARSEAMEAQQVLVLARSEYWRHLDSHGCGARVSGTPARKRAIEEKLRKTMLEARQVHDKACEKYRILTQVAEDVAGTADGGFAFQQAWSVRRRAYEVYSEALRLYTEFTLIGELPEELELPEEPVAEHSATAKPN